LGRLASDTRTNAVLVSGSKSFLDLIAKLIEKVDLESAPSASQEIRVFRPKHLDVSQFHSVVQELLNGSQAIVRLAVDSANNSLVIRSSPENMEVVKNGLSELDQPKTRIEEPIHGSEPISVFFYWVDPKGKTNSPARADHDDQALLPEVIQGIMKRLQSKFAFRPENALLRSQTMVRVELPRQTDGKATFLAQGSSGGPQSMIRLKGKLDRNAASGYRLELEVMLAGDQSQKIESTIALVPNKTVCFAVAPGTTHMLFVKLEVESQVE
jgi:hypothetical protein